MKIKLCVLPLLLLFFLTACDQPVQGPAGPTAEEIAESLKADKAGLKEIISSYEQAIANGDAAACAAMFAPDGVLAPDGTDALGGKDIQAWYTNLIDNLDTTANMVLKLDVEEMDVHHDWAYARSINTGTMTTGDETSYFHSKSFYLFARQDDGTWKVRYYGFDETDDDDDDEEGDDD